MFLTALALVKRVGDLQAFSVDDSCLELGPADSHVGMLGITVLFQYRYILYFKQYDIIILLNSVFHMLQLRSAPVGGIASQKLCNR